MGKENREETFFLLPVCTEQEREKGIHVLQRVSNGGVSNIDEKILRTLEKEVQIWRPQWGW